MTHHAIQILHLSSQWLRWVTIHPGAAPQADDWGTIEGTPEQTLEQWAARKRNPRAGVVIYDGRPIYYTFALTLPNEALKQKDRILRLKMTQEIGLGEDAVFWTAVVQPKGAEVAQTDVFMVVARREAMRDIIEWGERHKIRHLWVGADLCAIRTLLGAAGGPAVVVSADAQGATLYHANAAHQILKDRVDAKAVRRPEPEWAAEVGRLCFGGEAPAILAERYPGLERQGRLDNGQLKRPVPGGPKLTGLSPKLMEFDPVLLGGIMEQALGKPPQDDLIREITPPALEVVMAKFTLARLIAATLVVAMALGGSGYWVAKARKVAAAELSQQAAAIEPSLRQLQVQETILRKIKSDRKPLLPVFEAIHKAAPAGVLVKTLNIGESGNIQIVAMTQSAVAPNQFALELAKSPVLDRISLKEVKPDLKTKIFTFQIMGHAKGRGR